MATQSIHAPTNAELRPADDWLETSRIGTILDDLFSTMGPELPVEDAAR